MIAIMSADLVEALSRIAAAERGVAAGAFLFHRDDPVRDMFVLLEGVVQLVRFQADGSLIVLQRAEGGAVIAEASLFAERYHCDGQAATDARVLVIRRPLLRQRLRSESELAEAWLRHLSRQLQQARLQSEILALNRVGERLDLWLDWHDGELPPRGEWTALARQLGVTREALYREMAKRRDAARA